MSNNLQYININHTNNRKWKSWDRQLQYSPEQAMQTQLPDPGGQPTEPGAHVKWASETCEPAQTRRCECQGMDQYSLKSSLLPFIIIYNEQHLFYQGRPYLNPLTQELKLRILNQIVQEVQTEPQHIPECPFNLNRNTSEPPSENSDDYLDDSEVKASETFVPENIKSKYFQNSELTFLTILQSSLQIPVPTASWYRWAIFRQPSTDEEGNIPRHII